VMQPPSTQEDVDKAKGYNPLFTNQIFDDEEIVGYSDLQIDIFITQDTFLTYMVHKFGRKEFPANDFVRLLKKEFPEGLHTSPEELHTARVCHPMSLP
jgi:hypothetical protein